MVGCSVAGLGGVSDDLAATGSTEGKSLDCGWTRGGGSDFDDGRPLLFFEGACWVWDSGCDGLLPPLVVLDGSDIPLGKEIPCVGASSCFTALPTIALGEDSPMGGFGVGDSVASFPKTVLSFGPE